MPAFSDTGFPYDWSLPTASRPNMLLSVDNMTEHLRYIGKCGAMDINFYIENEIRAIKKISKADVDRAARQSLVENNMGFAAIGADDAEKLVDAVEI